MIDLSDPTTFKLSAEEYEWYLKDDDLISNSVARKDPEKSFLVAMRENRNHYKTLTVDGTSVHNVIKGL